MPQLVPQQPPPAHYYADNVAFVLREVRDRSGELLTAEEARFIDTLLAASNAAQRLFARLLSRSGRWMRCATLRYAEVGCAERAVTELVQAGLVTRNPPAPADALLNLLTRAEQQALFPEVRARTKPEWVRACVSRYPDGLIRAHLACRHPWLGVPGRRPFRVCQVLFFGSDASDLTAFIMQDLGLLRYESYALGRHTRPFAERRQLDRYLQSRRMSHWSRWLDDTPDAAAAILRLLWAPALCRTEQRARDRVLNRVGRWHERRGATEQALACYGRSTSHPARERRARLLHAQGDSAGVEGLLAAMRDDPWAPEEEDFAQRFPGRRSTVGLTITVSPLSGPTPPRIEQHALSELTANGGRGWHLENLLPLGLAGLVYWEEVFAPLSGAFSHPLQLGPRDLFWPDFARSREAALASRRQTLAVPGALERWLCDVHQRKAGTANHLVHWGAITREVVEALLACVPHALLLDLATHTIGDLQRARTGFPDLLVVYGPGAWELVEVKGPTDQLQPAQRVWLRNLDHLGIPARVLRYRAC